MIVFHYRRHVLLAICRQHVLPPPRLFSASDVSLLQHPTGKPLYLTLTSHAAPCNGWGEVGGVGLRRHILPRNALIPLEAVRPGSLCHYRRLNGVITRLGVCLRCAGQACVVRREPKNGLLRQSGEEHEWERTGWGKKREQVWEVYPKAD